MYLIKINGEIKMINGIKPSLQTTTKLRIKPTSFNEAMNVFCEKLEQDAQEYIERFNFIDSVTFKACGGRKYIKVKYFQTNIDTDYETGEKTLLKDKNGSIHCFVEKTTGDIFKPAGWKAPYLKGNNAVRGNIYDKSSFKKTDMHGGWLYAR
tara:strand:+ start:265 stop:720 length:456 start_codon:yes stop_codon:yes gene_type:complete